MIVLRHLPGLLKRTCAIVCLLSVTPLFGQSLTLRLVVSSRVPSKLSEWNLHRDAVKAIVSNPGEPVDARFEAELTRDGVVLAETKFADMPVVKIYNGVSTFSADDIIPEKALSLGGDVDRATGRLAPGTYSLAVRLCAGGLELGLCLFSKQMVVVADTFLPPTLLHPENKDVINTEVPVLFSWMPASTLPSTKLRYRLQIYLLEAGKTAAEIVNAGKPLVVAEDSVTQFILKPGATISRKTPGTYVWTVMPVVGPNDAAGEGLGQAEPFVFTVKE